MTADEATLPEKAARLSAWFERTVRVTVAYSAGVDSTLVLAAAVRALGAENVLAVTAVSASLPSGAADQAARFAAELGVRHSLVPTNELDVPGYTANGSDRCYFCKATLIETVTALITDGELLVTGTNADDVGDGWRPGIRAARERGVGTPLADTAMTKQDVRDLSRAWRLPTWGQPASPCLSSRIAYGVAITPHRLARVDRAEAAVRELAGAAGVRLHDLRVRDLGDGVRVDVDLDHVESVRALDGLAAALNGAGFVDPVCTVAAFRSGALNDVLAPELRYR